MKALKCLSAFREFMGAWNRPYGSAEYGTTGYFQGICEGYLVGVLGV